MQQITPQDTPHSAPSNKKMFDENSYDICSHSTVEIKLEINNRKLKSLK